jgi:hypothetical protein
MENIPIIRLGDVAGGALQEIAQEAIADVVANMQDVNTPWKPMRMVTIKLKLTQNEDRDDATMQISVEKKTAAVKPVETKFSMGKDLRDGSIYMEEYGPQIKGQMSFDDYAGQQGPARGAETSKVTGFRAKEA